jgi:hypothetical protein
MPIEVVLAIMFVSAIVCGMANLLFPEHVMRLNLAIIPERLVVPFLANRKVVRISGAVFLLLGTTLFMAWLAGLIV